MILANQVQFTALTKHTASRLDGVVAITGVISDKGSGVGSNGTVEVVLTIEIGVSSSSDHTVGFGIKVGIGSDLENMEVCLGIVPATAVITASSQLNVAAPISPIGRGHLSPVSSVVQVSYAIKPPVLFF